MGEDSARAMLTLGTHSVRFYVNDELKETKVYTITREDGSLATFPPISGINAVTQLEIVDCALFRVNEKTNEWAKLGAQAQLSELNADTYLTPVLDVRNAGDVAIELAMTVFVDGEEFPFKDIILRPWSDESYSFSMEHALEYIMKPGEHTVYWHVNGLYKTELVFTVTE